MDLDRLGDYIAEKHSYFQIGWGTFGQFFQFFAFESFAILFCEKFGISGYPSLLIYIVAPFAIFLFVILLGETMVITGYQHKYQKKGADFNNEWKEVVQIMKLVKSKIENGESL